MILLNLASSGRAQSGYPGGPHYDVSYSGGTVTSTGGPYPVAFRSTDYSLSSNQTYGGADVAYSPQGSGAGPNVTCSGEITATFTWVPTPDDEPPPDSVIVEKDSNTYCGTTPDFGGGCDDDLGDPLVDGYNYESCSGSKYIVKSSPGTSFTVTCSPSAIASLDSDGSYGTASVTFKATATPILIDIRWGIGPTYTKHFMIGQSVFAFLNTGDLPSDSYNWTVNGGKPFDNYAAFNDHAKYFPLFTTQPNTNQSVYCYFAKPDRATFTCQANVMGLPVTATRDVLLEKPSAEISVQIGSVVDYGNPSNPAGVTLALPGHTYGTDSDPMGITWTGNVLTPTGFDFYDDIGQWNWTQLAIPDYQQVKNGQVQRLMLYSTFPATPINGIECLDNVYPYGSWYPADGTDHSDSDAPNADLTPDPAVTQLDINASFHDYLMYQPPGSDSVVVPLKELSWFWQGQGTQAGGFWSTSNKNAQWGFDGDFPNHPVWTIQLLNNYVNFLP